jgi:DNA polymerase elongation subunit (family B)
MDSNSNSNSNSNLIFQPYDWKIADTGKFQPDELRIYALNKESERYLIRIPKFPIIQRAEICSKTRHTWTKEKITMLRELFPKDIKSKVSNFSFSQRTRFMYYSEQKFPIVDFVFEKVADAKNFMNYFKFKRYFSGFGEIEFKFWETDIDFIRKYHFVCGKLNYCDWIEIDSNNYKELEHIHVSEEDLKLSTESLSTNDDSENKNSEETKSELTKISNVNTREFIVDNWKAIRKISNIDTSSWITKPKILSFDIETYSHDPLVMPEKTCIEDEITMITITLSKYKDTKSKKIVLTIGRSHKITDADEIKYFTNERDMLVEFLTIIKNEDPTIITGYNIFSYDMPYIDQRISMLMNRDSWGHISVLEDEMVRFKSRKLESKAFGTNITVETDMIAGRMMIDMLTVMRLDYAGLESHTLGAVAEKFCGRKKLDMPAKRMFSIHKRFIEFKDKHKTNYDLIISDHLSGKTQNIELKSELDSLLADYKLFIDYGIRDADLVDALFNKLEMWIGLTVSANIYGINPIDVYNRGQIHRAKSRLYYVANSKGYFLNARKLTDEGKYKGAYVAEPEIGRHYGVSCYDFASLYPSIMIAYNICPSTMIQPTLQDLDMEEKWKSYYTNIDEMEKLQKTLEKSFKDLSQRKFVEKMLEMDSIQIESKNITKLTESQKQNLKTLFRLKSELNQLSKILEKVDTLKENEMKLNASVVNVDYFKSIGMPTPEELKVMDEVTPFKNDEDDSELKIHKICGTSYDAGGNRYRVAHKFVMSDKRKGLIPESVEDLLKERKKVREKLKDLQTEDEQCKPDADPVLYSILDQTQLRLKVAANSTYGFLGALKTNGYSNKGCAESVTIKGFNSIKLLNYTLQTKYNARVVYNDTDSAFIVFEGVENKDVMTRAKDVLSEINGQKPGSVPLFRPPMKLEFEKAMIVVFICKKKYPYYLLDKNGNIVTDPKTGKPVYKKKGITSARRDNCKWATEHVDMLSKKILDGCSFEDAFDHCGKILNECFEESVSINKLIFKNRIRTLEYANENIPLQVFIEHRKTLGRPVALGETVEFIYVDNGEKKVAKKMYDIGIYKDKLEEAGLKINKEGFIVPSDDSKMDEFKTQEDLKKYVKNQMTEHNIYPIDYKHYLMSRLCDNVDKIFYSGFKKVSDAIEREDISYTGTNKKNPIFFNKPLEAFLEYYIDRFKELKNEKKTKRMHEKMFVAVKNAILENIVNKK